MDTATFRRDTAATALVATAVLSAVSVLTAPEFPSGYADRLAALDAAGARAWVSATTFALAQLPFLVGILGLGHLVRVKAPRLGIAAVCLAAVGAFGHAVFSGVSLTSIAMARDATGRDAMAHVLEDVEASPTMVFAAMGLLGTVLATIVLAIGLWRTGTGPRWVPALIGAFVVVEFVGTGLVAWASAVSAALFLVALTALAHTLHESPRASWAPTVGRAPALPAADVDA